MWRPADPPSERPRHCDRRTATVAVRLGPLRRPGVRWVPRPGEPERVPGAKSGQKSKGSPAMPDSSSASRDAPLREPIDGASAWTGAELAADGSWNQSLQPADIAAIQAAFPDAAAATAEARVGKDGARTVRSRWSRTI